MNNKVGPEIPDLRKKGGAWLKQKREEAGLSQRELSELLNIKFYNFISQIENGRSRVPVEIMEPWARALKIPLHQFAATMIFYFDPLLYKALFSNENENIDEQKN